METWNFPVSAALPSSCPLMPKAVQVQTPALQQEQEL
jgi:hypothetical protein